MVNLMGNSEAFFGVVVCLLLFCPRLRAAESRLWLAQTPTI